MSESGGDREEHGRFLYLASKVGHIRDLDGAFQELAANPRNHGETSIRPSRVPREMAREKCHT